MGKTEQQLNDAGIEYSVAHLPIEDIARALTDDKTDGQAKLLVDHAGRVVGGHILAPNAGDLIAPLVLAIRFGIAADALADTLFPYPTMVQYATKIADEIEAN